MFRSHGQDNYGSSRSNVEHAIECRSLPPAPRATPNRLLWNRQRVHIRHMSRIQVSPEIHFGKPCVAGTRIPVQAVLELVRDDMPAEMVIRDYYPDLKPEDIKTCVQYAIDIVQSEDLHVSAVA
jgi:uncharacterized protein (DUF433 family)